MRHIIFHLPNDVISCEHCKETLEKTTIEDLTQHCLVCPEIKRFDPGQRYTCYRCNYSTPSRDHMRKHIRVHRGEKPFKCGVCSYKARESSALKKHMRTHTGERPYKCSCCQLDFITAKSLKVHYFKFHGMNPNREFYRKNFVSHQFLVCTGS
uniref:Transcriptional repressor CTCFL n=1 Tax=Cacopsylla melanoneura TaxID=428564 RepID=A0A8D8PUC3_9HEMI